MNDMFRRQMMDYVEYHRDPRNGLMHVVGIVFLFLGVMLPLSLWHFDAFGLRISLGAIMALPVLAYWVLLDTALGAGVSGVRGRAPCCGHDDRRPRPWNRPVGPVCRARHPWLRGAGGRPPGLRAKQAIAPGSSGSSLAWTDVCDGEIVHGARLAAFRGRDHRAELVSGTACIGPAPRRSTLTLLMNVLVTGGSGFIGQYLVSALVARGERVRVLDVRCPTHMASEVQYIEGSVLDANAVRAAVTGVDQVYHLAGLPGMWMPDRRGLPPRQLRGHGDRACRGAQLRREALPALLDRVDPVRLSRRQRRGCSSRTARSRDARRLYALEGARRSARDAGSRGGLSRRRRHADHADRAA